MSRITAYTLTGILSLVVFLILLFPASIIWQYFGRDYLLSSSVKMPGARVTGITGTVWNGSARLGNPDVLSSKLEWHLADISLSDLQVTYDISLIEEGIELAMEVITDGRNLTFSGMTGTVQGASISKLTRQFGLQFDGKIYLDSVSLMIEGLKPVLVSGSIRWTGGNTEYNSGILRMTHQLPEMQGKLATSDSGLHQLTVTNENNLVFTAGLSQDGWVSVNARPEFFMPEQPVARAETLENQAFVYEEKLW